MVYSDNFAEGMGLLILLIAGLTFVLVVMEMPIVYWILKRTENQNLRRAILVIALVPGLLLAMSSFLGSGSPAMVFFSLLFIGPVAALIPPFVFPGFTGPGTRFMRVLAGFFAIIIFEFFLVYGSLQLSVYTGNADFRDFPVFSAVIYTGLVILDILFACAVYRYILVLFPGLQEQDGNPA
jgi:hypothetical protein